MIKAVLLALIRLYQLTLSRVILAAVGPVCRFEPSCSRYAFACIEGQGALRGSLLSAKRLCKCHPFHPGGYDPPPPPRHRAGAPPTAAALACPSSQPAREGPTQDRTPADPSEGTKARLEGHAPRADFPFSSRNEEV